jgi:hypothetical protein
MTEIEPVRLAPPKSANRTYGWAAIADGEWWLMRDVPPEVLSQHGPECAKIRVSAIGWAKRHGYTCETRRTHGGARFYVRFIETERAQ